MKWREMIFDNGNLMNSFRRFILLDWFWCYPFVGEVSRMIVDRRLLEQERWEKFFVPFSYFFWPKNISKWYANYTAGFGSVDMRSRSLCPREGGVFFIVDQVQIDLIYRSFFKLNKPLWWSTKLCVFIALNKWKNMSERTHMTYAFATFSFKSIGSANVRKEIMWEIEKVTNRKLIACNRIILSIPFNHFDGNKSESIFRLL